ncbi:urease accessory protein [Pseudoduganella flava]|uniref:HupE-UreJ family metal transporter n=1 Tax=Pseudoduganella flava TaxID=871742 RepID=A0A562PHF4_9BURK|nr:HupE/UreJ family protein [Pseudoduganella flava]QGZ42521.1 HupE-UreJ family metal transporter [Pseudoduganella flava]TWI43670.1 urease accessory protein [Pseudoduganella flava]
MKQPYHILFLAGLLAAGSALAHPGHPGHPEGGIAAGMLHPLTGIDHLLALLAAGIWSARQQQGRALAAVFVAMMGVGAAAGMAGWQVPGLEGGIALTVLVTGVLVAAAVTLPAWAGAALLGSFAILHGNAHGIELPHAASAIGYLATSALLLFAGRLLGRLPLARYAGAPIAIAGLGLLAL